MTLSHVVSLVDDLMALDKLEEALVVLRRGQRWLQGRKDETGWDAIDDDREYYPPGVQPYQHGGIEDEGGGYPLETPLRQRLAFIRFRLGDDDEAIVRCYSPHLSLHLERLTPDPRRRTTQPRCDAVSRPL